VKKLLLVSQLAPPSGLIAARRVAALAKYLPRHGFEITVLTSKISGEGEITGAAEVVRTRDLLASGLNWRRQSLSVMSNGVAGEYRGPSPLQSVLVPDPAVISWLPFALQRALRLAQERSFDCVLTTSPPQTAHLVGAALARRGVCWVAELRDGWTFEPPRPEWPLRSLRAFDRRLERSLRGAAAVVGVTAPIVDDLQQRLGLDARLITNGFDPEETPARDSEPLLEARKHSVVHTGRIGVTGTRLGPLLEALWLLRDETALEFVFAGPLSESEAQELAGEKLVRTVGSVGRAHVLRLQRAADTLLVLTEGAQRKSVATGKLFEYLAAGKPVLVIGRETEAARIVEETGVGEAASSTDSKEIATVLKRALGGGLRFQPDAAALRRYSWPELAGTYAELIESCCRG
jgi:glycosyltransferase involved in cell wall biosynthesis